ncbi:MAG TPA: class II SORL domain-containing protein [Tissierellaceae bacterium]|nr:class II SORL domain-containing protein [Tissierellaceae bacterium]
MTTFNGLYQSGDWKGEKHVPVIHAPESVKAGDEVEVKVLIGEEIPHPNTFEHYIAWIKVFFHPEGAKFPIEIATFDFAAHGESDLLTAPYGVTKFKVSKSGTILASSYCNIHGLWENNQELKVEE